MSTYTVTAATPEGERVENLMRSPIAPAAVNARKTHCVNGHEFTPENTQTWHGKRQCRTCKREQQNERRKVNGRTN